MKLTLQNLKQLIKETIEVAIEDEEKEYYITFISGRTEEGVVKLARNRRDMSLGGLELEELLNIWKNRGVREDILQWYRDAVEKLTTLNIANNIWYDVKYTPDRGDISAVPRHLPYVEE